jgi:hypothetical protein
MYVIFDARPIAAIDNLDVTNSTGKQTISGCFLIIDIFFFILQKATPCSGEETRQLTHESSVTTTRDHIFCVYLSFFFFGSHPEGRISPAGAKVDLPLRYVNDIFSEL